MENIPSEATENWGLAEVVKLLLAPKWDAPEQRAYDLQGADWNQEVFPLILNVRELLTKRGVPLDQ